MPNLEQIVRPFVVVGTSPPAVAPSTSGAPPPGIVVIAIGKGGSPKTLGTSASESISSYMTGQHKEVKSPDGSTGGGSGAGTAPSGTGGGSQSGAGTPDSGGGPVSGGPQ